MKKGIKRLIIVAVVAGAAVGAFFIYQSVAGSGEASAQFDSEPMTSAAAIGDVVLSVSGSGNLGAGDTAAVMADGHVVIDEVLLAEGEYVAEGDALATVDTDEMGVYAQQLADEIEATQTGIDTKNGYSTVMTIKATADGWVKNAVLDEDGLIEDAMSEYGYVALVATEERELIAADGSGLSEGDAVRVACEGVWHDGTVTSESGALYVSIDSVARTVGAEAVVYDTDEKELFTGAIELAAYETIESNFGVITDVRLDEDDEAAQGEAIYKAEQYSLEVQNLFEDLADMEEEYAEVTALIEAGVVTSPVNGVVGSVAAKDGQTMQDGEALMSIECTDTWAATVAVDELDIGTVEIGQRVEVMLDSMPDETFEGAVAGISQLGMASGGITTYDVDIEVSPSGGFMLEMTLSCEITTQQALDVLTVPVDAVREGMGSSYVMVAIERTDAEKDAIKQLIENGELQSLTGYMGDGAANLGVRMLTDPTELLYGEVRGVETGLQDASNVEIISGLVEGETVLLPSAGDDDSISGMMQGMRGMMQGMGQMPGSGSGPGGGQRPGQ